jgi:hypothetical protein
MHPMFKICRDLISNTGVELEIGDVLDAAGTRCDGVDVI